MEEEHTEHAHHAEHKESGTITLKKDTLWKVGTGVFALLFVVSLFTGGFGIAGDPTGAAVGDTGNQPPEEPELNVQISDSDPILGNPNAKISMVEFSDFQCPFCQRAVTGPLADFQESDYFKDGEVNLVFKHLPLNSIHPFAQKAAEASECANRQGMFWEYHDLLFENQNALDVDSLKQYAVQLGLDTEAFNSCLDNDEARSKVLQDLAQASAAGARGTPYFVIVNHDNGKMAVVSGAVPWEQFDAKISSVM
jgi:protein-disulfide isomerase